MKEMTVLNTIGSGACLLLHCHLACSDQDKLPPPERDCCAYYHDSYLDQYCLNIYLLSRSCLLTPDQRTSTASVSSCLHVVERESLLLKPPVHITPTLNLVYTRVSWVCFVPSPNDLVYFSQTT